MKNLPIYFAALLFAFLIVSCKDSNDDESPLFGAYLSESVNIAIQDRTGADLLDPTRSGSFGSFKVYYLTDGSKELYHKAFMSAPGGYVIEKFPLDSCYHVNVLLNAPVSESNNTHAWTTYLEFESGRTDTIVAVYTIKPGYIAIETATYNGFPVWDLSKNNGGLQTYVIVNE